MAVLEVQNVSPSDFLSHDMNQMYQLHRSDLIELATYTKANGYIDVDIYELSSIHPWGPCQDNCPGVFV